MAADWTRAQVEDRLESAADVMRALPGVKPQGYFSAWPEYFAASIAEFGWTVPVQAAAHGRAQRVAGIIQPLRKQGRTLHQIAAELNRPGVPTARGGSASGQSRRLVTRPMFTVIEQTTAGGASLRIIATELNARGVKTARGGGWSGEIAPGC